MSDETPVIRGFDDEAGHGEQPAGDRVIALFESVAGSENKSATGVVDARYELAWPFEQGLGVERDVDRTIALYGEAAENGSEDAMATLECLGRQRTPRTENRQPDTKTEHCDLKGDPLRSDRTTRYSPAE